MDFRQSRIFDPIHRPVCCRTLPVSIHQNDVMPSSGQFRADVDSGGGFTATALLTPN
jgi:hypothetical protein